MYTRDGVVYITTLFDMFPDFDFDGDSTDEEHGDSFKSSY